MDSKKKKIIFAAIALFALIILIAVGSTFAYFSATISSEDGAVNLTAAQFQIKFSDDTDLIKSSIIPSIEEYVDIAAKRVDEDGNFLKPYKDEETNEMVTKDTVCIDDNLNEICSLYTFTIENPMDDHTLPIYVSIETTINTFENLYYKVLDSELNEVTPATRMQDDRYETGADGAFLKTEEGELIPKENFDELKISPIVLSDISQTLPASTDEENLSGVTYTLVIWLMETGDDQTTEDSGKIFAGTLHVTASGEEGKGITGTFSTGGVE